jgi:hypothetical protein
MNYKKELLHAFYDFIDNINHLLPLNRKIESMN